MSNRYASPILSHAPGLDEVPRNSLLSVLAMLLLGCFFTLSGAGKIIDVPAFAAVLGAYGISAGAANALAIVIPALEVVLGVGLLTWHGGRAMGFVCVATLVAFTGAFAFAHFSRGVADCGCFGAIEALRTPPLVSLARNVILLLFAVWLFARPVMAGPLSAIIQAFGKILVCFAGAVAFALGGISSASGKLRFGPDPALGRAVAELPIAPFVAPAPGTRLVLALEPGCMTCWNALENARAFLREGVVEHFEAIAGGDEKGLAEFRAKFQPQFPIRLVGEADLEKVVQDFPTAWLLRDDRVVAVFRRSVPSPHTWLLGAAARGWPLTPKKAPAVASRIEPRPAPELPRPVPSPTPFSDKQE